MESLKGKIPERKLVVMDDAQSIHGCIFTPVGLAGAA